MRTDARGFDLLPRAEDFNITTQGLRPEISVARLQLAVACLCARIDSPIQSDHPSAPPLTQTAICASYYSSGL